MKEHDSSTEKTYSPESGSLLWAHPINRTVAPLWDGGVCNLVLFCITRSLICHWNFRERCRAQMCLILSSDASRKGSCWNYLDSWKWEVSFPDYLLLQSISRERWRAPQAVSHQDLCPGVVWHPSSQDYGLFLKRHLGGGRKETTAWDKK